MEFFVNPGCSEDSMDRDECEQSEADFAKYAFHLDSSSSPSGENMSAVVEPFDGLDPSDS